MSKLKYDESFPERAGEYAAQGLNNTRIARELGIAEDTFYVYLKQFPALAEAVELERRRRLGRRRCPECGSGRFKHPGKFQV